MQCVLQQMASHIGQASEMHTVMEGWSGESEMLLHKTWPRSLSSKRSDFRRRDFGQKQEEVNSLSAQKKKQTNWGGRGRLQKRTKTAAGDTRSIKKGSD